MNSLTDEQNDMLIAAVDLVARSGATKFEVGHHDDEPGSKWWATARYRGALLMVDNQPDPATAAEALARRVLHGGRCAHCNRPVRIGRAAPGSGLQVGRQRRRECAWHRVRTYWAMGCRPVPDPLPGPAAPASGT